MTMSTIEVTEELLKEVKNHLNITFTEKDTSITNSIRFGMAMIISKVGYVEFDDESVVNLTAKDLLMNYCRYDQDGFRQEFERDYRSDILALQISNATSKADDKNG